MDEPWKQIVATVIAFVTGGGAYKLATVVLAWVRDSKRDGNDEVRQSRKDSLAELADIIDRLKADIRELKESKQESERRQMERERVCQHQIMQLRKRIRKIEDENDRLRRGDTEASSEEVAQLEQEEEDSGDTGKRPTGVGP